MKHQKTFSVCLKISEVVFLRFLNIEIFRKRNVFLFPYLPYWQPSSEITRIHLNQILDSPVDSLFISKMSDYFIFDGNFNNLPLHFHSLYAVISLLKVLF